DNFTPPSFSNFKIVGGPSNSINQSWINGKASYSQSYVYIIEPKRKGNFIIAPASIEYDGKTYKSNSVKITVTKEVEIPKNPNDPRYVAQQNLHLVAEVSNTNPYLGEGIYVVYKLYVSDNISVNDFRVSEAPQYNGFWNQDIKVTDSNVKMGKYNGKPYRYLVLKRAVLIPQRDGKLVIEPMKMDLSVGIPTGRGDFFGNMITNNIRYSASTKKRNVNVKALPQNGKPTNFSGAVGEFDFTVKTDKSTLKANDAAQITVQVSGRGNLKLFDLPKIVTPPELEVYTPEYKEQVSTALNGLKGTISEAYTVVPQNRGKYKIPEVTFSYFSPKNKTYKTIKTSPIYLDVTDGKGVASASNASNKKQVTTSGNDFRYIALNTEFEPKTKAPFFQSTWFYILLFFPLIAIPIAVLIGNKREERAKDVAGNKIRRANRLARKYLSEAKKKLGKKEAFYVALEKALHNFLKAKLHIETSDISKDKISEFLAKRNVKNEDIQEFLIVLNNCDFARYTPTSNVTMQHDFEKAKLVITKLDKQL
ncbi:MAG TPA: BatD family protein, partial [Flavobacteriaceae bacterium]|nr:BatD family protein [Flavobacteriaceae bacterium]